ncbi:hypothetical protein LTR84_000524 [Exophiala bonariae]|uniref:EamA domain-containing protein n=1 Tax=Exophiala bonariae TaxID=1690606 RepID=A0AAV9NRC3_9EURO|nr:hypothetical protein LTR84_000524 [Exophiala bonariae]
MSMDTNSLHQADVDISIPRHDTNLASPSSSRTINTPSLPIESRPSYLDVPSFRPSRPSLDSTYSDLSELSFHSNELQTQHPIIRSILPHDAKTASPPRSRIAAAFHSFYVTNYGAILVLASQVFGAGMNVSTRLLETPGPHGAAMHPFQIIFTRQSITTLLCTTYGIYTKAVPHFPLGPPDARWLLVLRGLFGFFGVFGLYFSLLYLPLSEATVLTFLAPILSCYICSFIIPGQTFSKQQQIAGFVSLVGVLFIAQPASLISSPTSNPDSVPSPTHNSNSNTSASSNSTSPSHAAGPQDPTTDQHLLAIGIAMLGVFGATGALTLIRAIGTRAHAFISINYFSAWCTIVSLAALLIFPDVNFRFPANLTEWGLLLSLGVCGFVMQFLLTAGLAYGGPTAESHAKYGFNTRPHQRRQSGHKPRDVESNDASERRWSHDLETPPPPPPPNSPKTSSSGTRATSMVYTQMLFALAGDKFVFGVSPGMMSWIGSVLILAGAIWVASARDKDEQDRNGRGGDGEDDGNINIGRRGSRHAAHRQTKHADTAVVRETGEATGLMNDIDDIDDRNNDAEDNDGSNDMHASHRRHGQPESVELRDLSPVQQSLALNMNVPHAQMPLASNYV